MTPKFKSDSSDVLDYEANTVLARVSDIGTFVVGTECRGPQVI